MTVRRKARAVPIAVGGRDPVIALQLLKVREERSVARES